MAIFLRHQRLLSVKFKLVIFDFFHEIKENVMKKKEGNNERYKTHEKQFLSQGKSCCILFFDPQLITRFSCDNFFSKRPDKRFFC